MIDEHINIKFSADTQEMENAAQQASMIAQQKALSNAAQMQANIAMMQSAPHVGKLTGQGLYAQQAYIQARNMSIPSDPYQMSINGFYNMPLVNPTPEVGSSYNYPYGLLDGPFPVEQERKKGLLHNLGVFAKDKMMSTARFIGRNIINEPSLGMYGAGDPYTPLYRSQQINADRIARGKENILLGAQDTAMNLAGAAWTGAGIASLAPNLLGKSTWFGAPWRAIGHAMNVIPGGLPVHLALEAAMMAAQSTYGEIADQRDFYKETGRYFMDATAPNFRDRIGGGASYTRAGKFSEGLSKIASKDKWKLKEDYKDIFEFGNIEGLFQTYNDEQKFIKGTENIMKSLKAFNTIAVQINEAKPFIKQMSTLGLNVADTPAMASQFIGTLGLGAAGAGITKADLMTQAVNAGTALSHQKIDAATGARFYMQSAGLVGELVRSGGISFRDLQKLGGREGITQSFVGGLGATMASPFGDMVTMSMLRDPSMQNKLMSGIGDPTDVMQNLRGMTPREYYNLQYKKSSLTAEMNPVSLMLGTLVARTNADTKMLGRKLDEGEFNQRNIASGMESNQSKAIIEMVKNVDKIKANAEETMLSEAAKIRIEASRPDPTIFSNTGLWWKNKKESWFSSTGARWARKSLDREQSTYDAKMKDFMPDAFNLDPNATSMGAVTGLALLRARNPNMVADWETDVSSRMQDSSLKDFRNSYMTGGSYVSPNGMYHAFSNNTFVNKQLSSTPNQFQTHINMLRNTKHDSNVQLTPSEAKEAAIAKKKLRNGELLSEAEFGYLRKHVQSTGENVDDFIADGLEVYQMSQVSKYMYDTAETRADLSRSFNGKTSSKAEEMGYGIYARLTDKERYSARVKLVKSASEGDFDSYAVDLANIGMGYKKGDKGFITKVGDLKNLSKEEREGLSAFSKLVSREEQGGLLRGSMLEKFNKELDVAEGSKSKTEYLKTLKQNADAAEETIKSQLSWMGYGTYDTRGLSETGVFKNSLKLSMIKDIESGSFEHEGRALDQILSKDLLDKYKNGSMTKEQALAEEKTRTEKHNKALLELDPSYKKLYAEASIDFNKKGFLKKDYDKINLLKDLNRGEEAFAKEAIGYQTMSDAVSQDLVTLIGGSVKDSDLKKSLSGEIAMMKKGGAKGYEASSKFFEKLINDKSGLKDFGQAGKQFLQLSTLKGDDLDKAKESIKTSLLTYGSMDEDKRKGLEALLNNAASGNLNNKGIEDFLSAAQAIMRPNMNMFGALGGKNSARYIDSESKANLIKPFEEQQQLIATLNSLKESINLLPKSLKEAKSTDVEQAYGTIEADQLNVLKSINKNLENIRTTTALN